MIPFVKMHGLGNDFIMVARMTAPMTDPEAMDLSRRVNDRRLGIGGDGLILVERGAIAPFQMRMFNPDGSESEMCGNGIRCFAKFVRAKGYTQDSDLAVETGAGILEVHVCEDGQVRVNMGPARLKRRDIPALGPPEDEFKDQSIALEGLALRGTAVSMGNPHLVIFVEDVAGVPVETWGPKLEHHKAFPNRINVHFAQVLSANELIQRTWERGAGITLACGTGACACAVAAHVTGRSGRDVTIRLPGGTLSIEYATDGDVFMTGPAETAFEGEWGPEDATLRAAGAAVSAP